MQQEQQRAAGRSNSVQQHQPPTECPSPFLRLMTCDVATSGRPCIVHRRQKETVVLSVLFSYLLFPDLYDFIGGDGTNKLESKSCFKPTLDKVCVYCTRCV